jgi:hypothetical protein
MGSPGTEHPIEVFGAAFDATGKCVGIVEVPEGIWVLASGAGRTALRDVHRRVPQ